MLIARQNQFQLPKVKTSKFKNVCSWYALQFILCLFSFVVGSSSSIDADRYIDCTEYYIAKLSTQVKRSLRKEK